MFLVRCGACIVLYIVVKCHADDVHSDINGPGSGEYVPTLPEDQNMFAKVFKYAYDNFYRNSSKKINAEKSGSHDVRKKVHRNYPRQNLYNNALYPPINPPIVPPIAPQYIFPQHYYIPPAPPQMPHYPMYHYPHPPPPPPPPMPYHPHAYPYHYPPPPNQGKEKSAETQTTQNLWELYKELKAKFETTVITTAEPTQEYYHRHYNRRVQNVGYMPRDNNRRYNYQQQTYLYQQDLEKVSEEPFMRYTPISRRDNERSQSQVHKVRETEAKTPHTILTTVTHPREDPQGIRGFNITVPENIFEPREDDTEQVRAAKNKHWEKIIYNIRSSLGITEEPDSDSNDVTLPEYVKRDHAELSSLFFTETPEDLEAKKYGITLIEDSEQDSIEKCEHGFDWDAAEKENAKKTTKDWFQLYKEYKDKYEFPDYLSEKRRIERAEYKAKKKALYKSRGLTYDDGNSDDGATLGDNTFLNLGRDPNYYPGVLRNFLK